MLSKMLNTIIRQWPLAKMCISICKWFSFLIINIHKPCIRLRGGFDIMGEDAPCAHVGEMQEGREDEYE